MPILLIITHSFLPLRLLKTLKQILRIHQRHNPIKINRTTQSLVDPEYRRDVSWVREAGGFEQDVVESAVALHEGFEGVDALVLDGAADAAVGEVEPFGGGAGARGDG